MIGWIEVPRDRQIIRNGRRRKTVGGVDGSIAAVSRTRGEEKHTAVGRDNGVSTAAESTAVSSLVVSDGGRMDAAVRFTARNYLDRIFTKLNVHSRTEAALLYTRFRENSRPWD